MTKNRIIKLGGIASILGSISVLVADIAGIMIYEDHNPIKQTISQLAQGKYAYIQDIGLTLFGFGIILASISLYVWKSSSLKWVVGTIFLIIMGINTIVLAEFNQFAGTPGTTIHIIIAVLIAIIFFVCTLLLGYKFKEINKNWHYISLSIGIAFFIACSVFSLIPEKFEGIYERGIGVLLILWFIILGHNMIKV